MAFAECREHSANSPSPVTLGKQPESGSEGVGTSLRRTRLGQVGPADRGVNVRIWLGVLLYTDFFTDVTIF
jgi:hypothetical protein